MWLFVVEVRQCSCTSIKLHQVHSLTRNIPISNQSFGMGYRYIWPWGSQDVFTRTGGRDFCPLSSTEHEGWTPIWCWLLLIWHIIIVKVPQCDSSPKLLHSTPPLCRKQPSFKCWSVRNEVCDCLSLIHDTSDCTLILPFYFTTRSWYIDRLEFHIQVGRSLGSTLMSTKLYFFDSL